jgi:hypothetical protein
LLDFHVFTSALFNLQVLITEALKIGFRRRRRLLGGPKFEKMRVASWHITPPNSLYTWVGLSIFPLEYDGQATYIETHAKIVRI